MSGRSLKAPQRGSDLDSELFFDAPESNTKPPVREKISTLNKIVRSAVLFGTLLLPAGCYAVPEGPRRLTPDEGFNAFQRQTRNNPLFARPPELGPPKDDDEEESDDDEESTPEEPSPSITVNEAHFARGPIHPNTLNNQVVLKSANIQERHFQRVGARRFMLDIMQDVYRFDNRQKAQMEQQLQRVAQLVQQDMRMANALPRMAKIQLLIDQRQISISPKSSTLNYHFDWGLIISLNAQRTAADTISTLFALTEASLNEVIFLHFLDQRLLANGAVYKAGSVTPYEYLVPQNKTGTAEYDCNTIALMRYVELLQAGYQGFSYYHGSPRVEEQSAGHGWMQRELQLRDGRSCLWYISTSFALPGFHQEQINIAQASTSYRATGTHTPINGIYAALSGLSEREGWSWINPPLLDTRISSRATIYESALALELLRRPQIQDSRWLRDLMDQGMLAVVQFRDPARAAQLYNSMPPDMRAYYEVVFSGTPLDPSELPSLQGPVVTHHRYRASHRLQHASSQIQGRSPR